MIRARAACSAALVAAGLAGCASMSAPPGGVHDKIPPVVLSVLPESGATNVHVPAVEFTLDKVVNNPPPGSGSSLDQIFVISPVDGDPKVSWHRDHIDVKPRHGFRPNTAYTVTLLPGLRDLRGNVMKTSTTVVFSTGPEIPPLGILGRAFDWSAASPAAGAWIQAFPVTDTTLLYVAAADSAGQFTIGPFGPGRYVVRGFVDEDHNRALGRREKWDADTLTLSDARPAIELDLIERDTTPPRITTVQVQDSVTLAVTFDAALDPTWVPSAANVLVQRSDSIPLTIVRVASALTVEHERTDSIRRADSLAAAKAPPKPAADTGLLAVPAHAAPPTPKPATVAPGKIIYVRLSPGDPVLPGATYVVKVTGARGLLGKAGNSSRIVIVPKTPPKPVPPPGATNPAPTTPGKPPAA